MNAPRPANSPHGTHLTGPSAGIDGADLKSHAPRPASLPGAGISHRPGAVFRENVGPWAVGSWATVGGGGVAAGLTGIDATLGPWVWMVSGLAVGLAHGAGDAYDAPAWRFGRGRWLATYGVAVAALALLAAAYPLVAVGGFVLLTMWHFGAADAHDLNGTHARESTHVPGRIKPVLLRWFGGAARMALFFGALAWASPTAVAELGTAVGRVWPDALSGLAGVFEPLPGTPGPGWSAVLTESKVADAGRATLMLGGGAWLVSLIWRMGATPGSTPRAGRDILETLALVALAVWLDPLFVVGLYFLGWHAPRHIARRLRDQHVSEKTSHPLSEWWAFHRQTAWLWLPIWPAWIAVIVACGGASALGHPEAWAAALLAWFLVLTPVHHALNERRILSR